MKTMTEPTNKEMFNMNAVRATNDSVGEWDGQEEIAAENFNQIQDALYDAAPDDYNDDQLHDLMKTAWDNWGSDERLLTLTEKQIDQYINEIFPTYELRNKKFTLCEVCHQEILEGKPAHATTSGSIIDGEFVADENEHLMLVCENCGEQIQYVSGNLETALDAIDR
jgi:RNase P subunit RPR2